MTELSEAVVDTIAAVLFQHRYVAYGECRCGWRIPGYPNVNASSKQRRHIAEMIAAATDHLIDC